MLTNSEVPDDEHLSHQERYVNHTERWYNILVNCGNYGEHAMHVREFSLGALRAGKWQW